MAEKKPFIVVTRGKQGISIYSEEGTYEIPAFPVEHISDPTGVGDAFRGGFLSGYSHDLDLEICGQMGSVAATYCLEQRGPQGHTFTIQQFITRFRECFDDHGKLDCLLPSVASKVISVGA